jgi:hypothetical protein
VRWCAERCEEGGKHGKASHRSLCSGCGVRSSSPAAALPDLSVKGPGVQF